MKEFQKPKDINLQQYRALLALLRDKGLDYIEEAICTKMPQGHANVSTLYNIIVHVAAKAICRFCGEDPKVRQKEVDTFCQDLPQLVKEAIILKINPTMEGSE